MKSYRDALKGKLSERVLVNPRYSLRAFARDIGLSPSYLSQVLNGSRGLTGKKAPLVFKRLAFSDLDLKLFELEMKKEHSRADKTKRELQKQIDVALLNRNTLTLPAAHFELMSGWFAMVLLQLFFLKDAPLESEEKFVKFAAKKMSLPAQVVEHTISVFSELGIIKKVNRGLEPLHSSVWTNSEAPSTAIRAFHRQMIEQAISAIELQRMDERSLESLQLAVAKEDVPRMSEDIIKFSKILLRKYDRSNQRAGETVYGVNLQLFRLIESDEK